MFKSGIKRSFQSGPRGSRLLGFSHPMPRLWMILLVLALPFFIVSAGYFETLERSGAVGAFIADTSLPASIIGYLVLVFILKKQRI